MKTLRDKSLEGFHEQHHEPRERLQHFGCEQKTPVPKRVVQKVPFRHLGGLTSRLHIVTDVACASGLHTFERFRDVINPLRDRDARNLTLGRRG